MFSRSNPNKEQTIALAGLLQSSALVHQLATQDRHDRYALHESAYSLIRLDAQSTEEVYGSVSSVDLGLRTLIKIFSSRPGGSVREIYQYAIGVHQLSAKLFKLHKTSKVVQEGLEKIQLEYIDYYQEETYDDKLYQALADLYSTTISYLTPRIIVQGSQFRLQEEQTVHKVRTALFSGIRSAYLWHQVGGRRWQLLFNRRDYIEVARHLIA